MSKNKIVFVIGVVSMMMPFLGFPSSWEDFFSFAIGLVLVALSFSVAVRRRTAPKKPRRMRKASPSEFFVDGGIERVSEGTIANDGDTAVKS
jgi:membrane protein implicated in regulation of membrane protease activity